MVITGTFGLADLTELAIIGAFDGEMATAAVSDLPRMSPTI